MGNHQTDSRTVEKHGETGSRKGAKSASSLGWEGQLKTITR
jgi:hypothetical protein